jgi:hypothetical protein
MPLFVDDPKVKKMHEKKDLKSLVKALRASDKKVKSSAAWALEDLGSGIQDASVVDALIAAIQDSEIDGIAIQALAKIGDKRASDALLPLIADHHENRGVAAYALGELREPRAVDSLINLMSDGDFSVRRQAATALGRLGDKRAGDVLAKASIHDGYRDVRKAAADALEELGDPRMVDGILNDALSHMIEIYQRGKQVVSTGDFTISLDEGKIKGYGQKLNELGGLELMKRAFAIFSKWSNWPKEVVTDLFATWVGIGDWGKEG